MKKLLLLCIILTGCGYNAYYNTFYNAKEYYTKAMQSTPPNKDFLDKSVQKCEKLIKYYPTCKWVPEALFMMGKCFLEKGDYDNAIIKFEELIEYYPKHPLIDETYLNLAKVYIKKGNYPKVEVLLKKAKGKKEESAKLIIESYFSAGDYENTIKSGETFLSDFPKSPLKEEIFLILANACDSLMNFDNAIKYYESALKLTKDKKVKFAIALGKTLLSLKKPDDALKQLAQFKNLAVDTERVIIDIIEAQCYKEKQDFEKAIEILKNIQNSPLALYEIGVIYEENLVNLEKAKEYYESAGKSGSSELTKKATARAGRIEKLIKYQGGTIDSLQQDSLLQDSLQQDSTQTQEEGENQFLLAELYLLEFNAPDKALDEYAHVIQDFPKSKYTPKSAYAIAWTLEKEKQDTVKAISAYENVINNFTEETELVELSQRAIAKLKNDTIALVELSKKQEETLEGTALIELFPEESAKMFASGGKKDTLISTGALTELPQKQREERKEITAISESRDSGTTLVEPLQQVNATMKKDTTISTKTFTKLPSRQKETAKTALTSGFAVQVIACETKEEADSLSALLKNKYVLIYIENIPSYWRVRVGPYTTLSEAGAIKAKLQQEGYKDSWIVQIK